MHPRPFVLASNDAASPTWHSGSDVAPASSSICDGAKEENDGEALYEEGEVSVAA